MNLANGLPPTQGALADSISVSAGLIAIAAALVLWWPARRQWPLLSVALLITGTAAISGTGVGTWLQARTTDADQFVIDQISDWTGEAGFCVVGLAALTVIVVRIWKSGVNEYVLGAAVILPLTSSTIPGPLGEAAATACKWLAYGVGTGITQAFGV